MKKICPAETLFKALSKKHTLLIIYTLSSNELSFTELVKKLSINTSTLTERLKGLSINGIVEQKICSEDSRFHYYKLTNKGKKISHLIDKLGDISRSNF